MNDGADNSEATGTIAVRENGNKPASYNAVASSKFAESLAAITASPEAAKVMQRVALNALLDPRIAACSAASVCKCVLDLAGAGLRPDRRQAHLVAYGREATVIVGVAGYIDLAAEMGYRITSGVVLDGDAVACDMTTITLRISQADPFARPTRDNVRGAYAIARDRDGAVADVELIGRDELDLAERSGGRGEKQSPAWRDWYGEMARKVAIKRLCKRLPRTSQREDKLLSADLLDNGDTLAEPRSITRGCRSAESHAKPLCDRSEQGNNDQAEMLDQPPY